MNWHAVVGALFWTALFGLGLYLFAFDEDCDFCGHSRWQHGNKVCAGTDHVLGGHISQRRACNCTGHRSPNAKR